MTDTQPQTQGAHHIGLTVPVLADAKEFFTAALGFTVVGEKPDYPAAFISDGQIMLTLWEAKTEDPVAFNRHSNIGLHHFALSVRSIPELHDLHQRLQSRTDVAIEFAPEALGGLPAQHMMCAIPGGIRMELIAAE
jgi:catechol 2,3-dioxygenase-like lactoylglutathione lyase family enzyme